MAAIVLSWMVVFLYFQISDILNVTIWIVIHMHIKQVQGNQGINTQG